MNMEAGTMFHGTSIPPQQLEQVRMWLVITMSIIFIICLSLGSLDPGAT